MGTYLDRIVAAHRHASSVDTRSVASLEAAAAAGPAVRPFAAALSVPGVSVIAEVKRRSPSLGDIDATLDPSATARAYEDGGAACLSVLTDGEFFGGSDDDLRAARAATSLPVLRKDFTVSAADVYDARAMGADAVLLIVAALSTEEVKTFHQLAVTLGMDALVEVHDSPELDVALDCGATLIGVNQRDLASFTVDTERALRLVADIPNGVVKVAESGIDGPAAAARLADAGYDAVLVGETLVRAGDRAAAVRALRGAAG